MSVAFELDSALKRLESFGVRLGLETTHRLLSALGQPQSNVRAVLVAGTNGKGSTAALLAGMATAAGYRVGLYTSPHLESVQERLRIDGRAISAETLTEILSEVVTAAEDRLGYLPTYFEALTASSFVWFARQKVDLAVLEVGLGGRLDATNGCEPVLSLITEIGLEHQKYLGTTLASIGREKAGILRAGRPALAWVERSEARQAIEEVARQKGAHLSWANDRVEVLDRFDEDEHRQRIRLTTPGGRHDLALSLPGEHQVANLALATLAAEQLAAAGLDRIDAQAIATGAATTRWPGRLEWVGTKEAGPVLLDVAHNPDGAATLRRALDRLPGRYTLLFGALADKEVGRVLPVLAERASTVVLTAPASQRAIDPASLTEWVPEAAAVIRPERSAALSAALAAPADFVVVCGSVYLVGDIRMELRQRFGVPPPATETLFAS